MTKEEIKQYAESKVLEALTSVVERAYTDGYNDGVSQQKLAIPVKEDGVEYVDLDLPSGTLWATDYLRDEDGKVIKFVYDDAAKYELPTLEDIKELEMYCCPKSRGWFGRKGGEIELEKLEKKEYRKAYYTYFWLKGDDTNPTNKPVLLFSSTGFHIESLFMGTRFPVLLVKHVNI